MKGLGTMKSARHRICLSICVMITATVLPSTLLAQITFERAIEGDFDDYGFSVQQTLEGGYVLAGQTESFGGAWMDACLIKTDSVGETLWVRIYGDGGWDRAHSVQQTSDSSFIITGWKDIGGGWGLDIWLIKTDPSGDTLWTGISEVGNDDWGFSVQETEDNGYIIGGGGAGGMRLAKTDSVGTFDWIRVYGDVASEEGNCAQQTSDGGYVIVGWTESFGAGAEDVYLVRTDSVGDTVWTRTYGGTECERGYSVLQTSDGGYIVAGWTESFGTGSLDVWLIRTDSLGDTLWARTYGGTGLDYGRSLRATDDGGYIIAGYTWSFGAGRFDAYLVKTDSLGNTLWDRTYGSPWQDYAYSVQQTSDNGYIIAGSTVLGGGGDDFYLIKTDENGLVDRDMGVVSIDYPIPDTVFSDSTYPVVATVHNYRPTFVSFWVKATVGGYVDSVHEYGLRPDESLQVGFADWTVPSDDSTAYILSVCTYQADDVDSTNDCMQKTIFAYNPIGVEEGHDRPSVLDFRLVQNEPNPFHNLTVISYSLPAATEVTLEVYDITGRLVETLVNQSQQAGIHEVRWNSKDNPGGVYFYRLKACPERSAELGEGQSRRAGEFSDTKKMVVVE